MFFGKLALFAASLFTGAAFYVNFAEQPARLKLQPKALLTEWKPSYDKGFAMQASLAVIGGVAALYEFFLFSDLRWLLGGLVLLANWPYTLVVMMPINNKLKHTPVEEAGQMTQDLITRWGYLHAVRTTLGAVSLGLFLWAV
jgi:hypothetical protein